MSFSVGFVMVLGSVWVAYLGSSYPRKGLPWRLCGSSAASWGGYVSVVLCLAYSAGMAVSDLLAYGKVTFWLGLNLVYSSCFWVIPASVVFSALIGAMAGREQVRQTDSACPAWLCKATTLICVLLLGIAFYASLYEPNAVRLNTVHLTSPKVPAGSELRLIHLSDLHISRLGVRERRALRIVKAARPDLILLTGDYLSSRKAAPSAKEFLSRLHAEQGAFAVAGAGDRYINLSDTLEGTGVTLLRREPVAAHVRGINLRILGLSEGRARAGLAFSAAEPEEFTVLLRHSPWVHHSLPPADLLLAGQSHGGQVAVPPLRRLIVSHLGGDLRYDAGLFRGGTSTMCVSRGLGMEGGDAPRIRFLSPPEVTLIVVRGEG